MNKEFIWNQSLLDYKCFYFRFVRALTDRKNIYINVFLCLNSDQNNYQNLFGVLDNCFLVAYAIGMFFRYDIGFSC